MNYGGEMVNETLTREQMSNILRPYVRRALELLARVIDESKLTKDEIGKVLIVGGSSRLLDIRTGIENMFAGSADKILKPKDAEWNVAKGAGRIDYRKGEYYSAEDIGLILGDESATFYPLLHGYFSTSPHPLSHFHLASSFGIMDTSEYPRIVFAARDADGKIRVLDASVVARAYGFLTETIKMESLVNQALVFCVRIRSENTTDDNALYWEYSDMRLVYEAPTFGG
jgi:cell division ATPase FtsA